MSKPNDKTQGSAQAPTADTGPADVALVQPAPAGTQPSRQKRDENHGRGGLYVVANGERKRVECTKPAKAQTKKEAK